MKLTWEEIGLIAAGGVLAAVGGAYLVARRYYGPSSSCPEQAAQPFLIRTNYLQTPGGLDAAIAYRTKNYGAFPGFGDPSLNAHPPSYYAAPTTFFGVPVTMNRRVIPALKCVEASLKSSCASMPYQPRALSGLRLANTYHDNEVSNHVYGIAIDIDPMLNPCCLCTPGPAGPQNVLCQQPDTGPYSRMTMPECWIHVFERYGFYWLGHDPTLRDTMHFEFLGVPAADSGAPSVGAVLSPPGPWIGAE